MAVLCLQFKAHETPNNPSPNPVQVWAYATLVMRSPTGAGPTEAATVARIRPHAVHSQRLCRTPLPA